MRGTWQTTGGGGEGLGVLAVIAAGVLLAAAVAGPVAAAVTAAVNVILIAVCVVLGLAGVGVVVFAVARVRRRGLAAPREIPPWRPAEAVPPPSRPAIGRAGDVHLHLHGVSAAEIAAALAAVEDSRLGWSQAGRKGKGDRDAEVSGQGMGEEAGRLGWPVRR